MSRGVQPPPAERRQLRRLARWSEEQQLWRRLAGAVCSCAARCEDTGCAFTTCEQPAGCTAFHAAAHTTLSAGTQPAQYAGSGGREQIGWHACFCFLALGSYPNNAFVAI